MWCDVREEERGGERKGEGTSVKSSPSDHREWPARHTPFVTGELSWLSPLTSNVLVADLPSSALSLDLSRSSLTLTIGSPNGSFRFTLQNLLGGHRATHTKRDTPTKWSRGMEGNGR